MNEGDLIRVLDLLTLPPDAVQVQGADVETQARVATSRSWTGAPTVVGSGVASKVVAGVQTDELSMKVYVTKKLPERAIPPERRVPPTLTLPAVAGEIVTDVEAIGEQRVELLSNRVRPVAPGYSISLMEGSPGTFGAVVAKRNDPLRPLLLSNSHIIAQYGLAEKGAKIIQPAVGDGGSEVDAVATLLESVPFNFEPGFNNLCDAAIGTLSDRSDVVALIPLLGQPKEVGPRPATGASVQKTGRTTGHTTGTIKDVNYRTLMSYPKAGGGWGTLGFRDQVLCEKYTDGGDSGALVCDSAGRAVGLHWAGSTSTSVFSPLDFAFDALEVQLWKGDI